VAASRCEGRRATTRQSRSSRSAISCCSAAWRRRAGFRLAAECLGLLLAGVALGLGHWVDVIPPGAGESGEKVVNQTVLVSLLIAALGFALRAVQNGRRVLGRQPLRHWPVRLLTGE